jgi:glutathione synthase/RimK-type ligase-like ATP-grasp enzyme
MKKVLLLDTNVSSFPIYNFLDSCGYEVTVVGTNPKDYLAKYAKQYIQADYSNYEVLAEILDTYKFDSVIPGCNDISYFAAAKANELKGFYGIDSFYTTNIINNKSEFRNFALSNNISVPKVLTLDQAITSNETIIIKPTDAYSGRGVSVINDITNNRKKLIIESTEQAISFSKTGNYVIEEYIEGQLYSHTAFLFNNKIYADFIVIENCSSNKFTVDTSYIDYEFPENIKNNIRKDIESMSSILDLKNGLIHTQLIKTKDSFKIVEVTRRCPGDLYSLLIEKSTGFEYTKNYVMPFLNEKNYNTNTKTKDHTHILRHTISTIDECSITGISYNQPIQIDLFISLSTTGDVIRKSPFGRIGLLFLKCNSIEELKDLNSIAIKKDLYTII